jgi:hypothetical protein
MRGRLRSLARRLLGVRRASTYYVESRFNLYLVGSVPVTSTARSR